jgi:hypothetical protein
LADNPCGRGVSFPECCAASEPPADSSCHHGLCLRRRVPGGQYDAGWQTSACRIRVSQGPGRAGTADELPGQDRDVCHAAAAPAGGSPRHGIRGLFSSRFMRRGSCLGGVLTAALLALGGRALAQPPSTSLSQPPGPAYYVWGQVRSPGAYSFVASPDILELLSAAGGPTENANLRSIVLIRAVTQQRTSVNFQAILASGQVIRLSPGDVIVVPISSWLHVRDWLSVLTVATTLVTLTLTIANKVGT